MKILSRRWWAIAIGALAVAGVAVPASGAFARPGAATAPARAGSLGQTSGLLPRDHLTLENAMPL